MNQSRSLQEQKRSGTWQDRPAVNSTVRSGSRFKEVLYSLLDFLYPRRCVGCGQEGIWFCAECQGKIVTIQTPTCFFCQAISEDGKTCPTCRAHYTLTGVVVFGYHEGILKDAVHALKYDFIKELADPLGGLLASTLVRLTLFAHNLRSMGVEHPERSHRRVEGPIIVPIPLHRKRLAQRGFNQSELIAHEIARRLGFSVNKNLVRVRNVTPQVELSGNARRKNMTGVFAWRGQGLAGKTVLLVDDVATTGTTLDEAAKTLRSVGARQVWGVVVSKG